MRSPITCPDSLAAWLRLSLQCPPASGRTLLREIGTPQDVFTRPCDQLAAHVTPARARVLSSPPPADVQAYIDLCMRWCEQAPHHLVPQDSPHYPQHLLTLNDPPLLLYAAGHLSALRRPGLAIVGARHASVHGAQNAHAFAHHLASRGVCIISGMARGIDAAAHEGALAAAETRAAEGREGTSTVAVMGTGLLHCYPRAHADLAARIECQGLLLSELPLDWGPRAAHFPRRNRLVAGLSQGVLVVEAATGSGSLITARLANESGREVFAIPGSIHSPLARGCHALIRQGAKLVETAQDILEEFPAATLLEMTGQPDARSPLSASSDSAVADLDPEAAALLRAMAADPVSLDTLISHTGRSLDTLSAQLLALTLSGHVVRLSDGRYQSQRR